MNDWWLAIIAISVLTIAIIQVAAVVFALRAAQRVGDVMSRFERDVKPIVANLHAMSTDAARAAGAASAQVERVTQMMNDLSQRVDDTAAAVQSSIVGPAREGYAIFKGILAALAALRTPPRPRQKRPAAAEEEDALFIG